MNQNVIYVGIDVDDVRYHGSALDKRTGEVLDFQCRPTLKGLLQQLEKVRQYFNGADLKLCYEASYVGFSDRPASSGPTLISVQGWPGREGLVRGVYAACRLLSYLIVDRKIPRPKGNQESDMLTAARRHSAVPFQQIAESHCNAVDRCNQFFTAALAQKSV